MTPQLSGGSMEYKYRFRLTEEDYLQYLRFMVSTSSRNKSKGWWLRGAVPALLLFTVYYFRLHKLIWLDVTAVILSVIWVFVISDKIYAAFLYRRVNSNFVKKLNVGFKDVSVDFNDRRISVDGREISYDQIFKVLPMKDILIFFYGQDQLFIIPNRAIGESELVAQLMGYVDAMIVQANSISE